MKDLGERGLIIATSDGSKPQIVYVQRKIDDARKRGQANSSVAAPALLIKCVLVVLATSLPVAGLKFNKTAYSSLCHDQP